MRVLQGMAGGPLLALSQTLLLRISFARYPRCELPDVAAVLDLRCQNRVEVRTALRKLLQQLVGLKGLSRVGLEALARELTK